MLSLLSRVFRALCITRSYSSYLLQASLAACRGLKSQNLACTKHILIESLKMYFLLEPSSKRLLKNLNLTQSKGFLSYLRKNQECCVVGAAWWVLLAAWWVLCDGLLYGGCCMLRSGCCVASAAWWVLCDGCFVVGAAWWVLYDECSMMSALWWVLHGMGLQL